MVKEQLRQRAEMYCRLDVACDGALIILVLFIFGAALGMENGNVTWVILGVIMAFVGVVLLIKHIACVQLEIATNQLARREAWELNRSITWITPLDELRRDFCRYFGGELPKTVRTGRVLDHIRPEDGASVGQAVKHWLFMAKYPHIGLWYCDAGEWKLADAEDLNGEIVIFERRVAYKGRREVAYD